MGLRLLALCRRLKAVVGGNLTPAVAVVGPLAVESGAPDGGRRGHSSARVPWARIPQSPEEIDEKKYAHLGVGLSQLFNDQRFIQAQPDPAGPEIV